jgi:hypothetical protein
MVLALTGLETVELVRDIVLITFLAAAFLLLLVGGILGLLIYRRASRVIRRVDRTVDRAEAMVNKVETTTNSVRRTATAVGRGMRAGSLARGAARVVFGKRGRSRDDGDDD